MIVIARPLVYKLFAQVILNGISRTLDEGQPCEQAGFRRRFSMINHIHTTTKLIKVSQAKKAFDTAETEATIEALLTQGVLIQYIRVLRELHSAFMTKISPFYNDVVIDVKT
ncbi:unnamed protein product [Heligmosomoides polygyrus]|uniref:Reverse transcriptase domain-containing protein n=1 Tax=Heligmosomoides polygyrus TaxID=6339 RepID=A0A183GBS9_HELPZ|nr:unnamed protein product [Heligmosomoides polygyrus]